MTDKQYFVVLEDDWGLTDPWGLHENYPADGGVHLSTAFFAQAISCWVVLQADGKATVGAAASAYNVPERVVVRAVAWHPYLYLAGGTAMPLSDRVIETDGE